MTKEEAKTKWCPYGGLENTLKTMGVIMLAEIDEKKAASTAKEVDEAHFEKCIASDCMMWVNDKTERVPNGTVAESIGGGEYREVTAYKKINHGHCGLVK